MKDLESCARDEPNGRTHISGKPEDFEWTEDVQISGRYHLKQKTTAECAGSSKFSTDGLNVMSRSRVDLTVVSSYLLTTATEGSSKRL